MNHRPSTPRQEDNESAQWFGTFLALGFTLAGCVFAAICCAGLVEP